eukprot:scaffold3596_cov126-Cylindrotheca_fusiformis.AAC.17
MDLKEGILDDIENLLEVENMLYSENATVAAGPRKIKSAVDWRDRTRGSSFRKDLTDREEEEEEKKEPFDAVQDEVDQRCDEVSLGEVDGMDTEEKEEDEQSSETAFFWYRNSAANAGRNQVDIMNRILIEAGLQPFKEEEEAEPETTKDEPSLPIAMDGDASIASTVDKVFEMSMLTECSGPALYGQNISVEGNPIKEDIAEINGRGKALVSTDSPSKNVVIEQEKRTSKCTPEKEELFAVRATPVTPSFSHEAVDFYVDPTYENMNESDDEDEHPRTIRIQITDDDSYDEDQPFGEEKDILPHPVLMGQHRHDFSLHRTVQINAVEAFQDEHSDAQEARVVNVLSPLRNLFSPSKWKRSPKTPSTVGESPINNRASGDIESGNGVVRSDLNRRFTTAEEEANYHEGEERRKVQKRDICLMAILAFLLMLLVVVMSVLVAALQEKNAAVTRENLDFYKPDNGQ